MVQLLQLPLQIVDFLVFCLKLSDVGCVVVNDPFYGIANLPFGIIDVFTFHLHFQQLSLQPSHLFVTILELAL
jgi:hypothetical protein